MRLTLSSPFRPLIFMIGAASFTLPLSSGLDYDCIIDWGDGTITHQTSSISPTHVYPADDSYLIKITGRFPTVLFNDSCASRNDLLDIVQWGDVAWSTLVGSFYNCQNLVGTYTDVPNFLAVVSADDAFRECFKFQGKCNWNMPSLLSARRMYRHSEYNQTFVDLKVPALLSAQEFMEYVPEFNQPFFNDIPPTMLEAIRATAFDQDISMWDITRLTNATRCLEATPFSNENYDLALISFAAQDHNWNVNFHFGNAVCSSGDAQDAKDLLISHGWTITDGSI